MGLYDAPVQCMCDVRLHCVKHRLWCVFGMGTCRIQALPLSHDKPPSCAHAARSHHTTISDADILQKAVTGCLVNLQTADTELQAIPG